MTKERAANVLCIAGLGLLVAAGCAVGLSVGLAVAGVEFVLIGVAISRGNETGDE